MLRERLPMGYPHTTLAGGGASDVASMPIPEDEEVNQRHAAEERLRQAQKMEVMGRLTSGVAHDFNNIVTVMAGYSAMLLYRLQPDNPAYEAAEEIKKASDRAASLTRQLLAFSRKHIIEMQPVHLNSILTNMEKMLRRLMREDIELTIELDPALGFVRADPGQIEQIIMNLAINARDAMPSGGALIIETTHVAIGQHGVQGQYALRSTPYVRLAMSDTGCGMDAETRSHLFELFFTTKTLGRGTGLGLSTVYDIVKKSDGIIWVNSKSGCGTMFEIYLPRVEKPSAARHPSAPLREAEQGSETILVVEDEDAVRVLIRSILQCRGYTVLEASHGKEALLISTRHQGTIHLLLTDVVMPHVSGPDVARYLAPLRPAMKLLYMSGYRSNIPVPQGLTNDGAAFLAKPFTPDDLARQVRYVLDTSKH